MKTYVSVQSPYCFAWVVVVNQQTVFWSNFQCLYPDVYLWIKGGRGRAKLFLVHPIRHRMRWINAQHYYIQIRRVCSKRWRLFINVFSAPIQGRAQCVASLHSNIHEHMWSHDASKACHREGYITQTTNIHVLRIQCHVLVFSLHVIWHDLFVFHM